MILTNKRTTYTVNHSNETARLTGSISLNEDNVIESFNGSFTGLLEEGSMESNLGGFSYNEDSVTGTISKSIYGVPFSEEENLVSLLNDTIDRIKTEVETDILSE